MKERGLWGEGTLEWLVRECSLSGETFNLRLE